MNQKWTHNKGSRSVGLIGFALAASTFLSACEQPIIQKECTPDSTDPSCVTEELEPPRIFVDPPFGLGFECVTIGCDDTQSFTIENRGDGILKLPLVRLSVDSSTDFSVGYRQAEGSAAPPLVVDEETPILLTAGEQVHVDIRYVPSNAQSDIGSLWIDWTDGEKSFEDAVIERVEMDITTRVLGDPEARLETERLNFGFAELGETRELPIRIENVAEGTAILQVSQPQPSEGTPFEFQAIGEQSLVNPGEFAEFMVSFTPIELTSYEGSFIVTTTDPANPQYEIEVAGTAFRSPFLVVEEPNDWQVDFGDLRVGEERVQNITLKNVGGQPLQITPSLPLGVAEGFSINAALDVPMPAIPPLGRASIEVTAVPTTGGPLTGRIDLVTNDPGLPEDHIDLTTFGIAPDANFDVSQLDFGQLVQTWQSEAQTVSVSNPGTGELTVSAIEFELGSSSQVRLVDLPALPYKIDPGADPLLISVYVAATTLGAANATLLVTTDAVEEPVKRLPITAQVVSCDEGCPVANGSPTCGAGQCEIAACFDRFHDTDSSFDSGCECGEDDTPDGRIDIGAFPSVGAALGQINDRDQPRSVTRRGTLHDGEDVDFYFYRANDNSQISFSDDYRASVRLDYGPPGLLLCANFVDAGTGYGGANARRCGTNLSGGGGGTGNDDQDVSVWVEWAEGASPVCAEYQICMSANEDRCR